jgi:DNA-binding CsgD family transcriptional regulator/tetratricopeptide (TPR) repeat protein
LAGREEKPLIGEARRATIRRMGATATTSRVDLLERETVLAGLREALAEARSGRGGVVLVAGEAGAGKTAVVRRFCEEVRNSASVLWGDCDALFTPRPLAPFVDVAHATGGELLALVEGGAKPYGVASALLEQLATTGTTVVVLEDVHWADEATLDVLRIVGRRIESVPAMLVATYRDDELGRAHPLRVALGELPTRAVRRLKVPCLSLTAVAALAESSDVDAHELFARTSGNPFFVTEVLAAGVQEVPDSIRDAVLARTARLDARARELLDAIAIFPRQAEPWLLETVGSGTSDELESCLRTGIVTSAQGAIAFRHELARVVVEESIAPDRALTLHRRALAALADPPIGSRDLSRLAHHADAVRDRELVLTYAAGAAAEAAAVGAHREAADLYERAVRNASQLPPHELADLLERWSRECYLTDRSDEAIDALERAAACYHAVGDTLQEGATLARLGTILWCPGRGKESRVVARRAVDLLEQLPPGPDLARAYSSLAFALAQAPDEAGAWQAACRALELAESIGDPDALAYALVEFGWRLLGPDPVRGLAVLDRAAAIGGERGLVEVVGPAYLGRLNAAMWAGDSDRARAALEEGLAYVQREGDELHELYLLADGAQLDLAEGRWPDAVESAALVLGRRAVSTFPRTVALTVLARVRMRRGDPDVAPLLAEARGLAEPTGELWRMAPVALAAVEAAWLRGDAAAAREATEVVLARAVEVGGWSQVAQMQAWRKRAGVDEQPHPLATEGPYGLELSGGFEAAATAWTELGRPYEAALALADAGTEDALRRSHELLGELGARAPAAVVARRLRALGARDIPRGPRPATRENPAALTARELEILQLLKDGLRNATIAERLFLSERTIENHVSAILRKLGARSRGEAVAGAARLGVFGAG